jgi:hypothetical protein
MNPVLIWFIMAALLWAALWSANYLLPLLRLVRSYGPRPLRHFFMPRALVFWMCLMLLAVELDRWHEPGESSRLPGLDFREILDAELGRQGQEYFAAMVKSGLFRLESGVRYAHVRPEIAYALATVLRTVHEVGGAQQLVISSVNDRHHAQNSFHYRNLAIDFPIARLGIAPSRGHRIRRLLEKRLGPGYRVLYGNEGHSRHLHIQYEGEPWGADKVMALPLLEAAAAAQVDPALMLAWAKVTSGFESQFDDQRGHRGMLGISAEYLDSVSGGDSLDLQAYVRTGASLLRARLDAVDGDAGKALASLRLGLKRARQDNPPWWKDPVTSAWVDQILLESKNYRRQMEGGSITADDVDSLPAEPDTLGSFQ